MQEFHDIVAVIILLAAPLSISALAHVANVKVDIVANRLESFSSVLSFSDDLDEPIRALHLSFRDFLLSTDSEFRVHEEQVNTKLAAQCLRIMGSLKKKIFVIYQMPEQHGLLLRVGPSSSAFR